MSRYVITINTSAYKPMEFTRATWERGTENDFTVALNGYKVTETSLKKVKWRVSVFFGAGYNSNDPDFCNSNDWYAWLYDLTNKARISYWDKFCQLERTDNVSPYGYKQGFVDMELILHTLKEKGIVQIPFKLAYSTRKDCTRYEGCYMQIERK